MLLDKSRFPLLSWLEDHAFAMISEAQHLQVGDTQPWPYADASTLPWLGVPLLERGSGHPLEFDPASAERVAPETVALLQERPEITCAAFSILTPGAHILPHVDTKPDGTLRAHLGLVVPPECGIRIGPSFVHIDDGESLLFEGRIDHEAANASDVPRTVLLVDFRLDARERAYLDRELAKVDSHWFQAGAGAGLFGPEIITGVRT